MMETRLIFTWVCNLADTVSTLYLFGCGYTEVNPVMAWLLQSPLRFALVKIGAMTTVVAWLWWERDSRYARIASWVAAVTYGAVALYYIFFFTFLI